MKKDTNESFDLKNRTKYKRIGTYINSKTKIDFLCPKCNKTWKALPTNILQGSGCFNCSYTERSSTLPVSAEEFDNKLKVKGIQYKRVGDYTGTMYKTDFKCYTCGRIWDSRPNDILNGRGCPNCSISGFKKDTEAYLYFIQINDILKVGITNRNPALRYKELTSTYVEEIKVLKGTGRNIYDLEQLVHKSFVHINTNVLRSGNTECFDISLRANILQLLTHAILT